MAPRHLACDPKGVQALGQHSLFIDAAGCYPLPRGVRTYAPKGHTPVLEDWWPRAHLSAIRAISPEGKRHCPCHDRAFNAVAVVALLAHRLRAGPGRMVMLWDGPPLHRLPVISEFLVKGAASRLHLERLPAFAPELHPGEGLWAHLKEVERRNVCGFSLPHLRAERRVAVKRVRRKPRLIQGCFKGAGL